MLFEKRGLLLMEVFQQCDDFTVSFQQSRLFGLAKLPQSIGNQRGPIQSQSLHGECPHGRERMQRPVVEQQQMLVARFHPRIPQCQVRRMIGPIGRFELVAAVAAVQQICQIVGTTESLWLKMVHGQQAVSASATPQYSQAKFARCRTWSRSSVEMLMPFVSPTFAPIAVAGPQSLAGPRHCQSTVSESAV